MSEIIPAIIPKSFSDLKEKLSLVRGVAKWVQVDVLDGGLVPEKSWPYLKNPDQDFVTIIKEEEGLPFWEDFHFEVDLMVGNPDSVFRDWISAGVLRVIVHHESFGSGEEVSSFVDKFKAEYGSNESLVNTEIVVAINIDTPNDALGPLLSKIDAVQLMGIATIGKQGEPFDERVLKKISDLRGTNSDIVISVDGGVSLESAPSLIEAGATRLVAGSAIFKSDNISEAIESFRKITD